jgi:hypothetical protein
VSSNHSAAPRVSGGMTLRRLLTALLAACLLPFVLTGPAPASAASASSASAADATAAAVVPGAGWHLAQVSGRVDRLVLVSPTGEQTTVYERPVSRHYGGSSLLDWSADGTTALLVVQRRSGSLLLRVDVATGAVQQLAVELLNSAVLDPSGTGVLATSFQGARSNTLVLDRIAWSGARTRLRAGVNGLVTPGRGATVLVGSESGRKQYLLSTVDGSVLHAFRLHGYCTPIRWWDATRVLESCGVHGDLWTVDPATGVSDRLTAVHGRGDYGHYDARYVGSKLYVQVAGACGYSYVATVGKRRTKPLEVPGVTGSVLMVDTVGDRLLLEHAASCDDSRGTRSELALFDPATRTETPLVVLPRKTYFGRVLVFGEVRGSSY